MSYPKVAILGFHDGSAGQIETWFEEVCGFEIGCFIVEGEATPLVDSVSENLKRSNKRTSYPENGMFKGRPLFASLDWPDKIRSLGISNILLLTPDNVLRLRQLERAQEFGLNIVSAIHPSVRILADAIVEPGVWINAECIIGYKAEISRGVLLNTRVLVEHHNVLRQGCQLDPGVVMAGNVTVEECAHIHTSAVVINRITIGKQAIIGAGAVVISDVPDHATVVGVPARVIKIGGSPPRHS